jgi:hypothetical protein
MNDSTNTSFRNRCSQYWNFLQGELLPGKAIELEGLTPTLKRIIRVLEWVRVRAYSRNCGHVPLFDHNPRGGVKCVFEPHEAHWYKARSGAERPNALLKDCYGLRQVWVRGIARCMRI